MYFDKNTMKMLQRMGLKVENLEAEEVVIKLKNGRKLIFEAPQVVKTTMRGQASYQIVGTPKVEEDIPEEDVKMVMDKTGASREDVIRVLKEVNGDIAEAILRLMG